MRSFMTVLLAAGTAASLCAGASAATVTYQDGSTAPFVGGTYAGGQNTYVDSYGDYPSSGIYDHLYNYGGSNVVYIIADGTRSHTQVTRGLFRFDISSMIGNVNPANITGGTLTLYLDANGYYGNSQRAANPANTLEVDPITDANAGWAQGTKDGDTPAPTESSSTWDYQLQSSVNNSSGTAWAGSPGLETAGTDYDDANPLGTYALPTGTLSAPVAMNFTVPASLLQHWLSGTNAGVLVRFTNEAMTSTEWNQVQIVRPGSTAWSATYYPTLSIDYTSVPEPAGVALIAIGGGLLAMRRRRS